MITINFSSNNYRLFERIRRALAAACLLLVALMAIIIGTALSVRSEVGTLERKISEMEKSQEAFKTLLNERSRIVKELKDMSALLELRRFSWTQMLTNIEKSFPVGVALTSVEYNPKDRSLALDGKARSPESLRNLIVSLERETAFREPYLKHQSLDKGSIAFNVATFYQGVKTAGVGQR